MSDGCVVCGVVSDDYYSAVCEECHNKGIDVQETLYGPVVCNEDHDCFIDYKALDEHYREEYQKVDRSYLNDILDDFRPEAWRE
jgi:hypothetical protein